MVTSKDLNSACGFGCGVNFGLGLPGNPVVLLSRCVSGLSNIFRWRDGKRDGEHLHIRLIEPDETDEALRLLLGQHGRKADDAVVVDFVRYARHRQIDLKQTFVAVSGDRIVAACLPVVAPGRTALLMTSTAGSSRQIPGAIAGCVAATCNALDPKEVEIAQLLLEPPDTRTAAALHEHGFSELATLIYLQRSVTKIPPPPRLPQGCDLLSYTQENHDHFARGILASYEHSLDCPLLHGRRGIEDVIAGHKASGEFDPSLWFCLIEQEIELGVLLLSPVRSHGLMELVYIGLAPHARGRRLGDYFVDLALHSTASEELKLLTLAVDECNAPALHLYYRHGLGEVHRRLAMIRHVS